MNRLISQQVINIYDPAVCKDLDYKQMSHFDSCLRKILYFFPCPGGRGGHDWLTDVQLVEQVPAQEIEEEPISIIDQLLA